MARVHGGGDSDANNDDAVSIGSDGSRSMIIRKQVNWFVRTQI